MKTTSAARTEYHYRNGSDGDGVFTMWSFSGRVWYAAIRWDAIPEALRLTEDVRRHWNITHLHQPAPHPDLDVGEQVCTICNEVLHRDDNGKFVSCEKYYAQSAQS